MSELCNNQGSYKLKYMVLLEIQAFSLIMVFWEDTCHQRELGIKLHSALAPGPPSIMTEVGNDRYLLLKASTSSFFLSFFRLNNVHRQVRGKKVINK